MEDPIHEISSVIHTLTQSPPSAQAACLEAYFHPTASFTHPFCRTGSFGAEYLPHIFDTSLSSRWFILQIYQWYRILSPQIDLSVESVAFDPQHALLYVSIHQLFRIQWIPFHRSDVRLTTVLQLVEDETRAQEIEQFASKQGRKLLQNDYASQQAPRRKWLIASQNDLYQTDEFIKFVVFWGGCSLIRLCQYLATLGCVLGALVGWPVTYLAQVAYERRQEAVQREVRGRYMRVEEVEEERGAAVIAIVQRVKGWLRSTGTVGNEGEKEHFS